MTQRLTLSLMLLPWLDVSSALMILLLVQFYLYEETWLSFSYYILAITILSSYLLLFLYFLNQVMLYLLIVIPVTVSTLHWIFYMCIVSPNFMLAGMLMISYYFNRRYNSNLIHLNSVMPFARCQLPLHVFI